MQINPINNNQTFKACYRVPYTKEGRQALRQALKFEKSYNCLPVYSKVNSSAKNIVTFVHPFPYEHSYYDALTSVLYHNQELTKEEAEKLGIKFNILFKPKKMLLEKVCDIMNYQLDKARNKGIDVDSIWNRDYIYVTTNEDTEVVWKFMEQKIKKYLESALGDKKESDILEFAGAMLHFTPVPRYPVTEPKQNFIQRLLGKNERNKKKEIALLHQKYNELCSLLKNENLKAEDVKQITDKIKALEIEIDEKTEPAYIKMARFIVEQYNLEKERFNKLFFENREIISVDSVEELIEKL